MPHAVADRVWLRDDADGRAQRAVLATLLATLDAGGPPAGAPPLDGDGVLAAARRHRLTPLLHATRRDRLSPALAETCRRDRAVTTVRGMMLAAAAEECVAALAAAGVRSALLKGLAYNLALYGDAGCRPTSDIDLLVPQPARREAFLILRRIGFEPKAAAPGFDEADYHEVTWARGACTLDLHLALAPPARSAIDQAAVWRDVRPVTLGATAASVLSNVHAAVFHGLHMAIDHFEVPGMYLIDLARLLPTAADTAAACETARAWRCLRALRTALALTGDFLPAWAASQPGGPIVDLLADEVVVRFGAGRPLPRVHQLIRKVAHFDHPTDAVRYLAIQSRRNVREVLENRLRRRSAAQRLGV